MLFSRQAFVLQLKSVDLVFLFDLADLSFEVCLLLFLKGLFVLEALVLSLHVPLDVRNILLCFCLSIFLEIGQKLSILLLDPLLLPFQVFLALLLDMQQLAEESLVPGLLVLQLPGFDHACVLVLEEHLLRRHQIIHLFGLIL